MNSKKRLCGKSIKYLNVFGLFSAMLGFSIPLFHAAYAQVPSFDCSKATQLIEHLICESTELSALDVELAGTFKQALDASGERRSEVLDSQRQWLRSRTTVCPIAGKASSGLESDATNQCIINMYRSRIAALAVAAPASVGDITCEQGDTLTNAELSRFRALIVGKVGIPDFESFVTGDGSVFFVCRDRRHDPDNFLFRPPTVCNACGDFYSVHQENGTDVLSEGGVGGNSDGNGLQILYDDVGHPFVMVSGDYAVHGIMGVIYEMVGLDDGTVIPLVNASSSMDGECEPGGPQTQDELSDPEKIPRKDGHYEIVFRLSQTNCKTGKTSVKLLRFVSTESGFKKQ